PGAGFLAAGVLEPAVGISHEESVNAVLELGPKRRRIRSRHGLHSRATGIGDRAGAWYVPPAGRADTLLVLADGPSGNHTGHGCTGSGSGASAGGACASGIAAQHH